MDSLPKSSPLARWLALLALGLSSGLLHAQNVTVETDPVGAIVIPLKGASDTHVSLPLHRPSVLEATVSALSSNTSTATLTLSSTALTSSQFVYNSAGNQTNTYYLQVMTGTREGMYYTVTANGNTSVTVDANGDTLTGNVIPGDSVQVIPYWTLNTLFPNGNGTYTTTSLVPQTAIALPQNDTPGINLSAGSIYFYKSSATFAGPGWYKTGDVSHRYPDVILPPDSFFIVRHPASSADTQLVLLGSVPMTRQSVIINNLQGNTAQDNAISLPIPVDVTLAASGLYPNIISGSTSLVPTDFIAVYDPTSVAQNKSATAIYFYYSGTGFTGPGWRKTGDNPLTKHNADTIFQPGLGFLIRRGPRPSPGTVIWSFLPGYLQPPG